MKYTEKDLVRVAKRENNPNRNYLVVDPLQGKHVPVSPSAALSLFEELADTFKDQYDPNSTLLVGFAETATAIGAQAAISFGSRYIQTTREEIPGVDYLFFSEEHSHAAEQKLVKDDIDEIISGIDRIIFIEDEVTTGKTILNIISVLKKRYPDHKLFFSVASLLNGMSEEHQRKYQKEGIALFYLVKTDHSRYSDIADSFKTEGRYSVCDAAPAENYEEITINGAVNARRVVDAGAYFHHCQELQRKIFEKTGSVQGERILVLGTEECMYPALHVGKGFEEAGNFVRSHSTTRSPIAVCLEEEYPLQRRFELKSLYEDTRRTFLYNLTSYDRIIIVTDAVQSNSAGTNTLINAVKNYTTSIILIRWRL